MPYRLEWKPRVRRQLHRAPDLIRRAAVALIRALLHDPYPPQAEQLRDHYAGIWKIKVDGWRIFYRVNEQDRVITVIAVKRRDRDTYHTMF
jgi:addiction module RelE/StbE family toxin